MTNTDRSTDPAADGASPAAATQDYAAREDAPGDGAAAQSGAEPSKGPQQPPGEIGGPDGPEPTRYGDWEVGGRCTDF